MVTPFTGVWVEIDSKRGAINGAEVTPFTGVWVEMDFSETPKLKYGCHALHGRVSWNRLFRRERRRQSSRPSRACELKWIFLKHLNWNMDVTPFTGVWVEIDYLGVSDDDPIVTPFTGVWVEIDDRIPIIFIFSVTPFTGVWVEIKT